MDVSLGPLRTPSVEALDVEIVERKGRGHPDTICDALAEELSRSLCQVYVKKFGMVLHHNVDKVLLWGGSTRPAFGGGEVLAPIEVFIAGRATREFAGVSVPLEDLAVNGSRAWFRRSLAALDPERHVRMHCLVRPGSPDLVDLFVREQQRGRPLANDTSIGVGYAPQSELERVVAAVEARLNSREMRATAPAAGEDVKVLGLRRHDRIVLTVACAMIGRHLADLSDYVRAREQVRTAALDAACSITARAVVVDVNTADDLAAGRIYLTVTGTSAEAGDDGQAGRGNRANGLITPYRPMTLESAPGKNPVTHVGKLYQVAASGAARALVAELEEVTAAECYLVSQIGRPIDDPQIADVKLQLAPGARPRDLTAPVEEILHVQLARLSSLWRESIEEVTPSEGAPDLRHGRGSAP
jgi:S-adenosylmethionine synthetase